MRAVLAFVAFSLAACSTVPAGAATPPSFAIDPAQTVEGGFLRFPIRKLGSKSTKPSTVNFSVAPGTALLGSDYQDVRVAVVFQPGEYLRYVDVPTVDDTTPEPTETLTGRIAAGQNARLYKGSATGTITDPDVAPPIPPTCPPDQILVGGHCQPKPVEPPQPIQCPDGSTVIPPAVCPPTIPPPTPIQCSDGSQVVPPAVCPPVVVPPPGDVLSPTLEGAAPIASPFDPLAELVRDATIPPSASPDYVGAFRFILGDLGSNYDDEIVYPGQPGKSHLHQYYGLQGDAFTTYESARSAPPTANKLVNRTRYWRVATLDGNGNTIRADFISIYYKRRPASDPKCSLTSGDPQAEGNCVGIPNGLKFVFGFDTVTGQAPTGELWFNCQGPGAVSGHYANIAETKCPVGAQLGIVLEAPGCWDGKRLDSANHRDHVAYASYGTWGFKKCPPTHPYVIPQFSLGVWTTVPPGADITKWEFASAPMFPNVAKNRTFHADYGEGWDPVVKPIWVENCINKKLNCSGGQLGDGRRIKNYDQPIYGWVHPNPVVPIASIPRP